jgi:hypothetical protein
MLTDRPTKMGDMQCSTSRRVWIGGCIATDPFFSFLKQVNNRVLYANVCVCSILAIFCFSCVSLLYFPLSSTEREQFSLRLISSWLVTFNFFIFEMKKAKASLSLTLLFCLLPFYVHTKSVEQQQQQTSVRCASRSVVMIFQQLFHVFYHFFFFFVALLGLFSRGKYTRRVCVSALLSSNVALKKKRASSTSYALQYSIYLLTCVHCWCCSEAIVCLTFSFLSQTFFPLNSIDCVLFCFVPFLFFIFLLVSLFEMDCTHF